MGCFLISCPDYLKVSPAINQAWQAWQCWQNGSVGQLYPNGVPLAIVRAISEIDAGFAVGQSEAMEKARNKK